MPSLRTFAKIALCISILTGNGLLTTPGYAASASVIRTTDQGIHKVTVNGGQLFIITGIFEDTLAYKRSLSLFFQAANETDWQHVPIFKDKEIYSTQWFTVGRGDITLTDAVVVQHEKDVFLVIADRNPDKNIYKVTRYRFRPAGTEFPDAPAFLFAPQSSISSPGRKGDTVETILSREASAFSRD